MAISKNGLTIFALLVTLYILETGNFTEFSSLVSPVHYEEEHFLPHSREKRDVLTGQWNYIVDVVVNASDVETFEQIQSFLNTTSLPIQLDNMTEISSISITTVCSSTGTGFQCRCEELFAWPYSSCVTYGACDYISGGICKCINAIPADGQSCQPISALLAHSEYEVDVELNVTDIATVDYLRSLLTNGSFSLTLGLGPTVNVTHINITTVCYPNGTSFQCRCEDQFVWSHKNCITYGACDDITDDTCRCINAIPSNGQYCQPKTVPPVIYEYQIFIEVNTTDVDKLRNTLGNITFPIQISTQINISNANITTVCSQDDTGFQCRCEDDYLWPCDKCVTYGKCKGDTNSICGCIKAIPTDGQYCQSVQHQNTFSPTIVFLPTDITVCPLTTTSAPPSTAPPVVYEYLISVELNTKDVTLIEQLRTILRNTSFPISINNHIQIYDINISTVCYPSSAGFQCRCEDQYRWSCDQCFLYGFCDNITDDTCGCINALPPNGQYCQPVDQYTPPVVYEYRISIELNTTDVTVIDQLRNISYPISINNDIQISAVNISTVCYPSSAGFQCRCEDQYRWSCDQCFLYGFCDNITDDTCGCIDALPPNGQYCQPVDQYTAVPVIYEYLISIELTTANATVMDQLRALLGNISYPISINRNIEISDVNITTVCYPSSAGFQCRCEDQYRWSCDHCFLYGFCDNITDDTCGCINALPPNGQYCQPVDQHNITSCPFTTSSPSPTRFDVDILMRLDKEYTPELNDATSSTYKELESRIHSVTRQVEPDEIAEANEKLPKAMELIAPVIGSVSAIYNSPSSIIFPALTYTNGHMILICGPPDDINVGPISGSEWKFRGRIIKDSRRIKITTTNMMSTLRIDQVVPADAEVENQPGETYCIKYNYKIESCSGSQQEELRFICRVEEPKGYEMTTTMIIFREDVKCDDAQYGKGREGDRSSIGCDKGQEGSKTAVCKDGKWTLEVDSCIVTQIKELLIDSQDLVVEEVPQFVMNLSTTVQGEKTEITQSSATISAVVNILNTVAQTTTAVVQSVMQDVLETVDVIISDDARQSWEVLNTNETNNASSELLGSMETLSEGLIGEFAIVTQRIQLNKTTFNNSFGANLNSSVIIGIPNTNIDNVSITTITFATLNNVMPARNSSFDSSIFNATDNQTVSANTINAAVVLVKTDASIQNVTLSFDKRNNSLRLNPQCVFWNFTQLDNLGAWDDKGCIFVSDIDNTVTCRCNHLTSFSILMAIDIPESLRDSLAIITYVGVGISMASLVICLIIEGYVWKTITRNSTAFMRHVSIVNTALSLLIANICFIIGASIVDNAGGNSGENFKVPVNPCSTATFFMHFFYLALFFWMLVSGLLLFYRTVMVFSHMSKSTMLAIGFSLGYGCPLIIAVITVAVTAPQTKYIRKYNACWLNWEDTMALLALVIPALTIVFINILIVIVVLFKMLRRGVGDAAQSEEKHTLVVITRCVIILTPLFGLTWSLGVGTMLTTDGGTHIAFAFFNSLQGFFILVFGTLFDSKIRSILSRNVSTSNTGSNTTKSTSVGFSSFSGLNLISRLRGRRYMYRVSEAANSSSTGQSESFNSI
ncbi:hypothetical protein PAMP_013873 [Pampus punctatissimus]